MHLPKYALMICMRNISFIFSINGDKKEMVSHVVTVASYISAGLVYELKINIYIAANWIEYREPVPLRNVIGERRQYNNVN